MHIISGAKRDMFDTSKLQNNEKLKVKIRGDQDAFNFFSFLELERRTKRDCYSLEGNKQYFLRFLMSSVLV